MPWVPETCYWQGGGSAVAAGKKVDVGMKRVVDSREMRNLQKHFRSRWGMKLTASAIWPLWTSRARRSLVDVALVLGGGIHVSLARVPPRING